MEFEKEAKTLIDKYKEGCGEFDALDGDEVDNLIKHLRNHINLIEGNITNDEYDKLEDE